MRTVFCFYWRRPDSTIASFGTNYIFFITKLPPICYPLLTTAFPLFLSQNSKLFNDFLCFHFFHLPIECWLLQFGNMLFFLLKVLKYFLTGLLVLFLESRLWKGHLPIFDPSFIFLISFKLCTLSRFSHDSKINFSFFWFAQSFMGLFDNSPGIFGFGIFALIWMEH